MPRKLEDTMASPQTQQTSKPADKAPANGGAAAAAAPPAAAPTQRAARGTKQLTPLGYVNAVESARKRATGIEDRLLKQVPEGQRERASAMLKQNDGK